MQGFLKEERVWHSTHIWDQIKDPYANQTLLDTCIYTYHTANKTFQFKKGLMLDRQSHGTTIFLYTQVAPWHLHQMKREHYYCTNQNIFQCFFIYILYQT